MPIWFLVVKQLILTISRQRTQEQPYGGSSESRFRAFRNLLLGFCFCVLTVVVIFRFVVSPPPDMEEAKTNPATLTQPPKDYPSLPEEVSAREVAKPEMRSVSPETSLRLNEAPKSSNVNAKNGETWEEAIEQWADAMQRNDSGQIASFYAPVVEQYFLRRNATIEDVRRDKDAFLTHGGLIAQFKISDETVQTLTDDRVSVKLTKQIQSSQKGHYLPLLVVHSVLNLKKTDDGWKICRESDLSGQSLDRP